VDKAYREQLQSKFHFDEWASPSADASTEKVSADGLAVAGVEVGAWRAQRVDPLVVAGAASASRSFWTGGGQNQEVLLRLDLIETASPTAARELLLELLGEFQSPEVARQDNPAAGDLAFAVPGDTMLLFVRGQVVAMVRNAGRGAVPVAQFAKLVDGRLTGREVLGQPPG
jgi:hypothetical protein